jgi:thiamine biosynthesis lipoprotein
VTTLPTASFPALGTTATLVVTDEGARDHALAMLHAELGAIDLAASRFRPDSELSRLNSAGGRPVTVSPLFLEAVEAALRAARLTGGLVDPTVGRALEVIGYDRDFAAVALTGPAIRLEVRAVPGWQAVRVDPQAATVQIPSGVELDLGATAKALSADRAARAVAAATGVGVLVSLGGDISVGGPTPEEGWVVRISHHHADPPEAGGPSFSLRSGGLATSSTSVRRWQRGDRTMHHLIDPSTGSPAPEYWRTVSVAAGTCLDANIASCAAIILGGAAPGWLRARSLPARLVDPFDRVTTVSGWPSEPPVPAGLA